MKRRRRWEAATPGPERIQLGLQMIDESKVCMHIDMKRVYPVSVSVSAEIISRLPSLLLSPAFSPTASSLGLLILLLLLLLLLLLSLQLIPFLFLYFFSSSSLISYFIFSFPLVSTGSV